LSATIGVAVTALVFGVTYGEAIALTLTVGLVWVAEMINTCVERTVDLLSFRPRELFGLGQPSIEEGKEAVFSFFDPAGETTLTASVSKSKNNPFLGRTLQGRVLPIGGLKQKVLAAHAAGLTDVILPERNRADLEEVPEDVRNEMTFHPVMSIDEVLGLALEPEGARVAAMS